MSITRREVLSCVVAGGPVLPAGADPEGTEPLTPQQAWHLNDGAAVTVPFEVGKDFAAAPEGEV
jgi:hypothetical protein